LKNTINTMVDQLNSFASEVTRVAKEVGSEGKLGGQAQVPGVGGTWKDLTDTVNVMAANLTEQVRGIVKVVTAVAEGDLEQNLFVQSKGEVAALADTINDMIKTLAIFADQVTTVAREVGVDGRLGGQANVPGASGTWKDLTGNVNLLAANLTTQVRAIAEVATAVTKGDLTRSIQVEARGEVADLKNNINTMIDNLRLTTDRNTEQDWLKTNLARFTAMLQGQRDLATVGSLLLSELATLLNANQGLFYQMESGGQPRLKRIAAYAGPASRSYPEHVELGEGFVGQCAVDRRPLMITDIPPDTVRIGPAFFDAIPRSVVVYPVAFEGQIKAVLALSSLNKFDPLHLALLEQLTANIGIVVNSIEVTMRTEALLKQSQNLAAQLQTRQTELQRTNQQLGQQASELAEQNAEVERKNREIEQARLALEEKATELALTSKYKSEFLANMSHELRTPLNSILILAQQLAENPDSNLTPKQVEFARTVHGAGSDLLNLITDILDLSKIESGTVTVEAEALTFSDVVASVGRAFHLEAERRKLEFAVELDPALPPHVVTDSKRLQQVLKNLLSNAFKFTAHGRVSLSVDVATDGWTADHPILDAADCVIAFRVTDTGIGIQPDKQKLIFEAFQQADAGTSRKYGGTGLGLAISRELASLLGGEITLSSVPGAGSTFSLLLPSHYVGPVEAPGAKRELRTHASEARPAARIARPVEVELPDDREHLAPGEPAIVIAEDDPGYARIVAERARENGFKVLIATRGGDAIDLVRRYKPAAVSLDIFLPDMLGWTVLSHLKRDPETRHIPVQVVSLDEDIKHGLARGAFAYVTKPSSSDALDVALARLRRFAMPRRKRLLVVDDDAAERESITALLAHDDVDITTAASGTAALVALNEQAYDCAVVDLKLPDISGFDVLEKIRDTPQLRELPIVVFTGRELSAEEDARLKTLARSVVVKGVESPDRLFDETALFLHRVIADLPAEKRKMLERLHGSDEDLVGKQVLVVDDDIRNIFALSSVLERRGMRVITANTGHEAIARLDAGPDAVLMDIMMPEMDGYETMREIRQSPRYRRLPIIALTAKAMKGDREKCLEAGASDYLAKPVNTEQLLSALRMWLHR
jgi:CheY-like chemotaxis protein/signal transduction histidine kinase/HAMP domain-containing protein